MDYPCILFIGPLMEFPRGGDGREAKLNFIVENQINIYQLS